MLSLSNRLTWCQGKMMALHPASQSNKIPGISTPPPPPGVRQAIIWSKLCSFFSNISAFGHNFFKFSTNVLNFQKNSSEISRISVATEIFMHSEMVNPDHMEWKTWRMWCDYAGVHESFYCTEFGRSRASGIEKEKYLQH